MFFAADSLVSHDPEVLRTPAINGYDEYLQRVVAARFQALLIPDEVSGPIYSVIGQLREVDERYNKHNLELSIEAQEVMLVSLDVAKEADEALGVHTNEAAIVAAAGTHDGGKRLIVDRKDPGIIIRSQNGGYTPQDHEDNKEHVDFSAEMVRTAGMPLIPVELFPGGPVEMVDIAKIDQSSHAKQIKGAYGGVQLGWAERRVRDYATIADQALAMLFRTNKYNEHLVSLEQRWEWVEGAITHVLGDYWYPPKVIAAVMEALRNSELIQAKLDQKYGVAAKAGALALVS